MCGYPAEVRRSCLLWMVSLYRAHIDDSGRGQEPVFVLAGFIATIDQWVNFTDEWSEALRSIRRLDYFKMKEAAAIEGQFRGWSEPERNNLLLQMVDIIERNVIAGVCSVIRHDDYRTVFKRRVSKAMDTPYFLSFYSIMSVAHRFQHRTKNTGPVDFIFDE